MAEELSFQAWLQKVMDDENLGVREFARRIGVSHPTVLDALAGLEPSLKTCKAIAEYTRMPLDIVLQKAGIMKGGPNRGDERRKELIHLNDMMNETNQDDLIAYARMRLQQQEREEKNKKNGKGKRPSNDL